MLRLECALVLGDPDALQVWLRLLSAVPDVLAPDLPCDFHGRAIAVGDVAGAIRSEEKHSFRVKADSLYLHFVPLGRFGISLLQIGECLRSADDASRWIESVASFPSFLEGRLFDEIYDRWQNARDPLQYEAARRPYAHLPMRSNGLPPPLDRMEIDTSANPGRRELRHGLIEAVGAPMWVGTKFLERVNIDEASLGMESWLNPQRLPSGAWKLSPRDRPFETAEGEERTLQLRMRAVLFGRADYPAGSA